MSEYQSRRLSPARAEAALRRAAELNAVESGGRRSRGSHGVSPEALAEAAERAGIPEERVRRAVSELSGGNPAEPRTLSRRLYGGAKIKVERQLATPARPTRERIEYLLREQGLKLRRGIDSGSLWDPGGAPGIVRQALDVSGERPLLRARCVELLVDERPGGCGVELTADLYEQRGEYLSLAGIVGATLSLPAAIAGVYEPLYLLALPPALAVPGFGFKLAYGNARRDIRNVLEALVESAEESGDPQNGQREPRRNRGGTAERRRGRYPRSSAGREASNRGDQRGSG